MLKFLFTLSFVVLSLSFVHAQSNRKEDVIQLNNNWVLRGRILSRTDSSVRIQTRDGNIFSFPANQVQRVGSEPAWSLADSVRSHWTIYTELGPLIAGKTTVDGVTTAAFSFQSVVGYQFRSSLMPGVGAGADLYATQTVLPLFGTLRGDLLRRTNYSLFAFGDAGYGLNITQRTSAGTSYGGGLLYAAGLGVRIPFNRSAGFLLSLGYRYQKTSETAQDVPSPVIYRRLALRAGFYL